jgi:hypothetical protein
MLVRSSCIACFKSASMSSLSAVQQHRNPCRDMIIPSVRYWLTSFKSATAVISHNLHSNPYGPRDLCRGETRNGMIARNDRLPDAGEEGYVCEKGRVRKSVAGFGAGKISLRDREEV